VEAVDFAGPDSSDIDRNREGNMPDDKSKQFDLGPTHDIPGVEIFAAGTWNGDTYTVEDLDEMVRAFEDTHERLKPYLKLGHDDKQKLLQRDGYPAAGYISRLYREGSKLVADFVKVPKAIFELLKVGGYRRVSSEIFVGMPVAGKVYRYLLKAVALLGGDTPAVQTLKDVLALYATGGAVEAYEADVPLKEYEMDGPNPKEGIMNEIEKLTAQLTEATKKFSDAQAKIQELEGLNGKVKELTDEAATAQKRIAELETQNADLKVEAKKFSDEKNKAEVNATLDKWIADKKIVPAQREAAFALLIDARERGQAERKYKIGDKDMSQEELILNFMQNNATGLPTKESTSQTAPHGDPAKGMDDAEKIDLKAKEWMEKNPGQSYREALAAVSPAGLPRTGEEPTEE
jgi:hypothetical protein